MSSRFPSRLISCVTVTCAHDGINGYLVNFIRQTGSDSISPTTSFAFNIYYWLVIAKIGIRYLWQRLDNLGSLDTNPNDPANRRDQIFRLFKPFIRII